MLDFKDKKILVFGLGLLGGGVATTNWLIRQGALVTITDLKSEEDLKESVDKIEGDVIFHLGGHEFGDVEKADIVVVNPDVPAKNKYVIYALEQGKTVVNEATIFFENWNKPIIGITGTRGKTTSVQWTNHFLNTHKRYSPAGNNPEHQFLKVLDQKDEFDGTVAEVASFHLEFFNDHTRAPEITAITNVSQDHLNRYESMEDYVLTKTKIFKNQTASQDLILNFDDPWTDFIVKQQPLCRVWYFATRPLPKSLKGLFYDAGSIFVQQGDRKERVLNLEGFAESHGIHNVKNLLTSSLIARLSEVPWQKIQNAIETLPQIKFRQETIYEDDKLKIINDTAATSPDGGLAALRRFKGPNTILITGGTDRELDYTDWGRELLEHIQQKNIILLSGSATEKMKTILGEWGSDIAEHDTLKECLETALQKTQQFDAATVLFSPASKSFEKFKNEFDRGEQFNRLVKELVQ